jgi:AraC family transcriptional regulator
MSQLGSTADKAIEGPVGGSIVTRDAVLARPGDVSFQYSRVVRSSWDDALIEMEPSGEPLCFVVKFPTQTVDCNLWCDGRLIVRHPCPSGSLSFHDFRQKWIVQVPNPIDSFHLWLPREVFRDLEENYHTSIVENLYIDPPEHCQDEVMLHLTAALMPSLSSAHEINRLFADHIFESMRLHLAQKYGGLTPHDFVYRGGLTFLQEKRAKDRLIDDLSDDTSLAELASICGLSVRQFARAFKRSTGLPPHRWLLMQRVDRAKVLLVTGDRPIGEIALACGFADQSHLTRVFSRAVGATPGIWRRERRS